MTICECTISFAGDAITAGSTVETRNHIRERADTIRAGFDISCTAHPLDPTRGLARRPNRKQRSVVETLGVKTRLNKRPFVGKRESVGRVPDVH